MRNRWTRTLAMLLALVAIAATRAAPAEAQNGGGSSEVLLDQASVEPLTGPAVWDALDAVQSFFGDGPSPAMDALRDGLLGLQLGPATVIDQIGSSNVATVAQQGARNVGVVHQAGDGNATAAIQEGNRNVLGAWLFGSSNQVRVEQRGDDNIYVLGFRGSGLDLTGQLATVQNGSRNVAVQLGDDPSSFFGIRQDGNDMSIWIQHNP